MKYVNTFLPAWRTGRPPDLLQYRWSDISYRQRRLAGRAILEPVIDLGAFKCRAVVDWINIQFLLTRTTQHQWLQEIAEDCIGRRCYIWTRNPAPGGVSSEFAIRVQEPNFRDIRKMCRAVEAKYGFAAEPGIDGLEVSVDFRPRELSDPLRRQMHGVLTRHFFTCQDVLTEPNDRPRFTFDAGERGTEHLLDRRMIFKNVEPSKLPDEGLLAPYTNGTYYVGARNSDCLWRIMDKIKDRQNRAAGSEVLLLDEQKRVRVEVSLRGPALTELGIRTLSDLKRISFSRFQGSHFTFKLPTFASMEASTIRDAGIAWKEYRRLTRFLKVGVMGMNELDGRDDQTRKDLVKTGRRVLRRSGVKVVPLRYRTSADSLVAFAALNKEVETALRHLGKRVRTQLG